MKDDRISRFLEIQSLEKETFFRAENFRAFYLQLDLSVGKISGRNTVIRFVGVYQAIGKNSSKMALASEGKAVGQDPFRLFTYSRPSIE